MPKNIREQIYEFENKIDYLGIKTDDGIPVYLMAKKIFINDCVIPKLLSALIYEDQRSASVGAAYYILRAFLNNIHIKRITKQKQICFYVPSRDTTVDGIFFNRFSDFFFGVYPDSTFTIEMSSPNWKWPFPRKHTDVIFDVLGRTKGVINGILLANKDQAKVALFLNYYNTELKKEFGVSFTQDELVRINRNICMTLGRVRETADWIDKTVPRFLKVFIMVGANYPTSYILNKRLKNRGIITADLQHGCITKGNPIYSYPDNIFNSKEIKEGTADYFLTYGDWWNDQIICPTNKISIGNPYRDFCLLRKKNNKRERIIVAGSGVNTKECIELTKGLQERLITYEVVFRPHPIEKKAVHDLMLNMDGDITLDLIDEVYDSLNVSNVIISEVSTVLFDAVGICDKIIIIDTEFSRFLIPDNPFIKCKGLSDIVDAILDTNLLTSREIAESVWKSDWKNNYRSFIEQCM